MFKGVYMQYRGKDGTLKTANFVDVVQVRMRSFNDALINGYLDLGYGLYFKQIFKKLFNLFYTATMRERWPFRTVALSLSKALWVTFTALSDFPCQAFTQSLSRLLKTLNSNPRQKP